MSPIRRFSIIALVFLLIEAALVACVDRPLSEWVRSAGEQNPGLIDFFRAFTDFGKSFWYLWPSGFGILVCALLIRKKTPASTMRERSRRIGEFSLFLFLAVASSGIVTDIIKPILGRARPVELERDGLYTFHPFTFDAKWNSFPSGHSATAMALALAVAHFFPRVRIPIFGIALALMVSRIMVSAHYLSDVLAGGAVAFLCVVWLKSLERRNGLFHIRQRIFPIDGL